MRRLILLAHISLDGYVAGVKGELDGFPVGDENLEFVCRLTHDADAALFGRNSYKLLEGYWPKAKDIPNNTKSQIEYSNWYNKVSKTVVSKTMLEENKENVIIIRDNISDEITKMKQETGEDILLFGSPALSQLLMQLSLIDIFWIFINPIIFGEGIPLFSGMANKIDLKLTETKQFANGEIALCYIK